MQQAIDYDTQLSRVHALLTEWGECQRREPSPMVQGYPRASVEGRMMDDCGWRTDKSRRWAWTGKGRPQRQTPVRAVKTGDEWPEHIQRVDRVLARLDVRSLRAVKLCYYVGLSTRQAAHEIGLSRAEFRRQLERAQWFLIGVFAEIDAAA